MKLSKKEKDWQNFSHSVEAHIRTYVVPQYGDSGSDPASEYTVEDIKKQIQKYAARIGSGSRGINEAIRDSMKIAHYAQMLNDNLRQDSYTQVGFVS